MTKMNGNDSLKDRSAKRDVILSVNGVQQQLALEPRRVLLDVLRCDLGLTGAKKVCEMGNCGACTVHVNGKAVYSCLMLGVECEGASITTIEGLAEGQKPDSLQQAFIDADAFQCGYCTPGQIMSLKAAFAQHPRPDDEQIQRAVSGNICRCGAYRNILKAGRLAADRQSDMGPCEQTQGGQNEGPDTPAVAVADRKNPA